MSTLWISETFLELMYKHDKKTRQIISYDNSINLTCQSQWAVTVSMYCFLEADDVKMLQKLNTEFNLNHPRACQYRSSLNSFLCNVPQQGFVNNQFTWVIMC